MDTFYIHTYCPCSLGHFGCRIEKSKFHSCKQKEHDISGRDVGGRRGIYGGRKKAGVSIKLFIALHRFPLGRGVDVSGHVMGGGGWPLFFALYERNE